MFSSDFIAQVEESLLLYGLQACLQNLLICPA